MADTKIVVNCETGEVAELALTQEELDQREADAAAWLAEQAAREATEAEKAEAKASAESKLAALGLTPEEIAAIRG